MQVQPFEITQSFFDIYLPTHLESCLANLNIDVVKIGIGEPKFAHYFVLSFNVSAVEVLHPMPLLEEAYNQRTFP